MSGDYNFSENEVKSMMHEIATDAYKKGLDDAANEVERRQAEREAAKRKPFEDEINRRIAKYKRG